MGQKENKYKRNNKTVKTGIIGAGHIGGNAAKLFARAGQEIAISDSRRPETLAELIKEIGGNAKAVTTQEAADFGEVVFISIP